jgi:hypothetical protein
MNTYQVIYQRHAVERMAQRGVSEEDVMHILLTGETIQVSLSQANCYLAGVIDAQSIL